MYHKKKEMGMGGRMEMGHGGDMERAVKIYLMKKGGKTAFPDLTGDGKVTFADILKGRLKKGKKKSMGNGGRNDDPPSFADRLSSNLSSAAEFLMDGPAISAYKAYKASPDNVKEGIHTALGGPLAYVYRRYMDGQASEAAESARPDQDPYGFVGPVMPGEDAVGPSRDEQPRPPRMIRREAPVVVEPLRSRGIPENTSPRNREIIVPREERRREINRDPFVLPDNLRGMGYGGKVKLMKKGGEVEYGLGGAVLAGINAIKNKEGLIGGIKNVAKAYATPGSGFAQGAKLAGGMLANSNNPALAGIGKVAGMAGNFMPGGAGVAGLAGNVMQNMGGGSGIASVMQPLQGLFKQRYGGYVSPKHRLLRG